MCFYSDDLCNVCLHLFVGFLDRMNRLSTLPRGFGSLPALEVLDLTYNNLNHNSLPGNFFYLSKSTLSVCYQLSVPFCTHFLLIFQDVRCNKHKNACSRPCLLFKGWTCFSLWPPAGIAFVLKSSDPQPQNDRAKNILLIITIWKKFYFENQVWTVRLGPMMWWLKQLVFLQNNSSVMAAE